MAITKRVKGLWRSKQEKPRRKARGVRTDEAKTARSAEDAATLIKDEALKRVIHGLPGHIRRSWPTGRAEHEETATGLMFTVRITRTTGDNVEHTVTIPHNVFISSTRGWLRGVAGDIAARIIVGVEQVEAKYLNEERRRDEDRWKEYASEEARVMRDVLDDMAEAKQPPTEPKSVVFCVVCGAEDRMKFPEWGPCIHEEAK